MSKQLKKFVFFYLPVLLWMGFIFYLSSIPGLNTGVESVALEIVFRKLAHLGEYAVLGFLVLRLLKLARNTPNKTAWALSLAIVAAFAASDEIHQFFVSQRAGRVWDVLIDAAGGLAGMGVFEIWKKNPITKK